MPLSTLLKKNTNKFLTWVAGSGPIETRISWHFSGQVLTAKIRSSQGLKGLDFPGMKENEKKVVLNFSLEESKLMLKEMLRMCWDVGVEVPNHKKKTNKEFLNKSGFARNAPDVSKLIVEFGSPNIAKPLHMGHLRSLVTGHFCARICENAGHDVKRVCFLGDWGTQFGILQAGLAKWLPDGVNGVKKLELSELLNYYVKAVQEKEANPSFFKEALKLSSKLEQGDEECVKVWETIREKTVAHLKNFWSLLDLEFDVIQGESEFAAKNEYTKKAIQALEEIGVLQVAEDGCTNVVLAKDEKFSKTAKFALMKSDGGSLYLLRDIACALQRQEIFQASRTLYVVDKTQANHFIALFRILQLLKLQHNQYHTDGWGKKLWHVTFGKIAGMSTRAGNFVLLSDVIRSGSEIMEENRIKSHNVRSAKDSRISTQLAISALIVNYLKVRRNRDLNFDWDEALRSSGDTGVSLQYTHARLVSLENNVKNQRQQLMVIDEFGLDIDYIINDPVALKLTIQLINFEDVFWSSYSELEPCIMVQYLFKLSDKISKSFSHLQVLSEPNENIAASRLQLFMISRKILAAGLSILGIKPLKEM